MKRVFTPALAGVIVGGIVGIGFGALSGLIAGFIAFAVAGMVDLARASKDNDPTLTGVAKLDELNPSLRQQIRPLMKTQEEIQTLLDRNRDNPILSVLSFEIDNEVRQVIAQSADLLVARGKLRKMMFGIAAAKNKLQSLEAKRQTETDSHVARSIDEAIAARRKEVENYEKLRLVDQRIEAALVSAESSLSEMRSRVVKTLAETADSEREYNRQELAEMARRLETLSQTMEQSAKALNLEAFES